MVKFVVYYSVSGGCVMFEVVHLVVGCSVLGSWLQGAEGAAHAAVCCHDDLQCVAMTISRQAALTNESCHSCMMHVTYDCVISHQSFALAATGNICRWDF